MVIYGRITIRYVNSRVWVVLRQTSWNTCRDEITAELDALAYVVYLREESPVLFSCVAMALHSCRILLIVLHQNWTIRINAVCDYRCRWEQEHRRESRIAIRWCHVHRSTAEKVKWLYAGVVSDSSGYRRITSLNFVFSVFVPPPPNYG